ncbi:hypothetical protein CVT24_010963 [Panaeolus cyanescens]|uniref:Uncharacterized protein n=1 Tax=Panaeolus cyanescens TaxID=181874 RepID=A0A409WDF2_9AGAR|nr:hypothetical protein CVT24_010963 [Panaeolus cyanescens]
MSTGPAETLDLDYHSLISSFLGPTLDTPTDPRRCRSGDQPVTAAPEHQYLIFVQKGQLDNLLRDLKARLTFKERQVESVMDEGITFFVGTFDVETIKFLDGHSAVTGITRNAKIDRGAFAPPPVFISVGKRNAMMKIGEIILVPQYYDVWDVSLYFFEVTSFDPSIRSGFYFGLGRPPCCNLDVTIPVPAVHVSDHTMGVITEQLEPRVVNVVRYVFDVHPLC